MARVRLGETEISERMVRDGYSVACNKRQSDYVSAELNARGNGRGLWSGRPAAGIDDPAAHRLWKAREEQ